MLLRIETYSAPAWEPGADEVTARSGAATGDVRLEVEIAPVEDAATDGGRPHRVAVHASRMWAVDGATGRPVWNVKVAVPRTFHDPPPTVVDGVPHAAEGGHLLTLDTATGSRRWTSFPTEAFNTR